MKIKLISLVLICCVGNLLSQETIFIKPFVSFTFDTTEIVIDGIFSNSFYDTEQYTFKSKSKDDPYFKLSISPKELSNTPTSAEVQNIISAELKEIRNKKVDSDLLIVAQEFESNQFKGIVSIFKLDNSEAQKYMHLSLEKIEEDRSISIDLTTHTELNSIDDIYSSNFETIHEITSNIVSYDIETLNQLDKKIEELYQIDVESLPLRNLYYYGIKEEGKTIRYQTYDRDSVPFEIEPAPFHHTFRGRLLVSPNLEHKAKEIRIKESTGYQVFSLEEGADFIFTSKDKLKGLIEKKGIFILVSDDGKEIEIPFSFSYENK